MRKKTKESDHTETEPTNEQLGNTLRFNHVLMLLLLFPDRGGGVRCHSTEKKELNVGLGVVVFFFVFKIRNNKHKHPQSLSGGVMV